MPSSRSSIARWKDEVPDLSELLKVIQPFDSLEATDRERIAIVARPLLIYRKSDLFFEPDSELNSGAPECFYIVHRGLLALASPQHLLLGYVGPNSAVGVAGALRGRPHRAVALAVTACEVFRIPAKALRDVVQRQTSNRFLLALIDFIDGEHMRLARYLEWVGAGGIRRRIASALLEACDALSAGPRHLAWEERLANLPESVRLEGFTEQAIATHLNASLQPVNAALKELADRRVLIREKRGVLRVVTVRGLIDYFNRHARVA